VTNKILNPKLMLNLFH